MSNPDLTPEGLVSALRNSKGWPTLGNAAADYIEHLTAELAEARATPAPADNAALVEGIKAIPRRKEVLGGQTLSYVQLGEVLDTIEDLSSRAAALTPAVAAWKCVDLVFHSYTIHTSDDEIIPHRQRRPDEYRITPLYAHPPAADLTAPPEDVGALETLRQIERETVQADDPQHHTLGVIKHLARAALATQKGEA